MSTNNPFGDYLISLAAELSAHVLANIPAWVQASWQGDETDTAVNRCLDAGITAFMRRASADASAYSELWEIIFPRFFKDEQVAAQVVHLLEGQRLNNRALLFMAKNAGYQPQQFPNLNFDLALKEFEGAFLTQATHETTLQGVIEANQMLQQTQLLAETKTLLEQIVSILRDISLEEIVGIKADSIIAQNVVSGTQITHKIMGDPTSNHPTHWQDHYLKAVLTRCGALDLTTLSASQATSDTLSIDAVFTTLYLDGLTRNTDQPLADLLIPQRGKTMPKTGHTEKRNDQESEKKRLLVTATEAVAYGHRLVILGQPGGGKSTLVNYVTAQLAQRRRDGTMAETNTWPEGYAPLPVRIILRRFADWMSKNERKGAVGDVWDYLEYLLGRWGCSDSFAGLRGKIISEGGLFFFDGLDEIRDEKSRRAIIKGAIAQFAKTEDKCQIVVTSRPYAYTNPQWQLPEDQFMVVRLAPFGSEQIEAFNHAWYSRVMGPRRDWSKEQCKKRAFRLTRTILARAHLRRLAASPLLLTLISQVDSSGTEAMLPRNRAELYRQTVDLLLARWENRIQLDDDPGEDVPDHEILFLDGLPTQELHDVLAKLAYEGHQQQSQQQDNVEEGIPVEITRETLRNALHHRFDSRKKVDEIILYIQNRTGLLVDKGDDVFTFPHRTYQEYLAGQHLQNTSGWQPRLIKHVKAAPDWWREVFLLSASSMSDPNGVQYLVRGLLPHGNMVTEQNSSSILIGAQALIETNFKYYVDLEQQEREQDPSAAVGVEGFTEFLQSVQAMLKQVMVADDLLSPKLRAEAGRWLAHLGDNRPGVGVIEQDGVTLPHILWSVEIPAGKYTIGDNKSDYDDEKPRECIIEAPYHIAKYPITTAQFQAFIDAPDGKDTRWWQDLPKNEQTFSEPSFPEDNSPRERVSWYQAVAFCRWLTAKLHTNLLLSEGLTQPLTQYEIVLPHEFEWEVAARWPNETVQERIYPWGPEFDANKANTSDQGGDKIRQTTAVSIYPSGKNKALELYDMSGNVWEWCRNKYEKPEFDQLDDSGETRVVRGGSWASGHYNSRAAVHSQSAPDNCNYYFGFRMVVRRATSLSKSNS